MIGKLASSTTATIAISLVVLVGMYILYRDMKKLETSIEKLQSRSACAKVLSVPPPVNDIEESESEEDDDDDEDDEEAEVIDQADTVEQADTEIEDVVNQLKQEVLSEELDSAKNEA